VPALTDFPSVSQISLVPINEAVYGSGRSYQIDTSYEQYRRQSTRHTTIPAQRESLNLEGKTGEGTINTEGLWRIQIPDWSYGAGQLYADRAGSVANRFLVSTGVDVFSTQYQATLLHATQLQYENEATFTNVVSVGPYVFHSTLTQVLYRTSWGAETSLTFSGSNFGSGEFITGLVADDHDVYISTNENIYQCQVMAASTPGTATIVVSGGAIVIGACGGKVFAIKYSQQYILVDITNIGNPTNPGVFPTNVNGAWIASHPNPKWVWTGACLVDGTFYFTGYASNNDATLIPNTEGQVWRATLQGSITVTQTGAQNAVLAAAQVALSLPPGEVVASIFSYGNLCLLGTTQGVRVCRSVSANDPEGNTGDLIAGPILPGLLQPVNGWVTGFTANGRYVWFIWTGYTDTAWNGTTSLNDAGQSTALTLGILDMETMVDDLQPAYASSYQFNSPNGGYGWALCWDPITSGPLVSVALASAGNGLWTINPDYYVAEGFIDTGLLTYNLPDDKIACMVSCRYYSGGSVAFNFNPNQGGYASMTPISPNTPSTTPELLSDLVRFEEGNLSIVLLPNVATTETPILRRVTLKSLPATVSGTTISAVCLLYSQVQSHGVKRAVDPYVELAWLESLRLSQQPLYYTEGNPNGTAYTATCVVNSIDWLPEHERDTGQYGWDGVAIVYLTALVG
jgi:hypothetical protein